MGRSEVSGPKSQVSGTKPVPSKKRAAETEDDVMPHDSVSQVGGPTAAVPRGNPAGSAGIPEAPPRTAPSVAPSFVSAATSLPQGQLSKARQLRAHVVLCAFSLDRRILNWAPPAAIAEYLAQGYLMASVSMARSPSSCSRWASTRRQAPTIQSRSSTTRLHGAGAL